MRFLRSGSSWADSHPLNKMVMMADMDFADNSYRRPMLERNKQGFLVLSWRFGAEVELRYDDFKDL